MFVYIEGALVGFMNKQFKSIKIHRIYNVTRTTESQTMHFSLLKTSKWHTSLYLIKYYRNMMEKATIYWRVLQNNKIRVIHITHKYEKAISKVINSPKD